MIKDIIIHQSPEWSWIRLLVLALDKNRPQSSLVWQDRLSGHSLRVDIMAGFLMSKCESCAALITAEVDDNDPEHVVCRGCGAKLIPLTPPGNKSKLQIWQRGMSKTKGRLAEMLISFAPQHNRGGALARHERLVDHQNDRYVESVTLCASGELTHSCDEPLTKHQGHGSKKK